MGMDIFDDEARATVMGTPCAESWDDEWIAEVDAREVEIGRRICGARTLGGTPCPMGSNHTSGRCKHHGGFNLTGARKGNRNAVVHGLYSQRLAVCGQHCPMWRRCPLAGDHIFALAPEERPLCPYEQQLFETALTDELGEMASWGDASSPLDKHHAHTGALQTVMLWRAAAAMAETPLVESNPQVDNRATTPDRVHPYTEAYLRLTRENERWRRFMERRRQARRLDKNPSAIPNVDDTLLHSMRNQHDTEYTGEDILYFETETDERTAWGRRIGVHALDAAARGDDSRTLAALTRATFLANAEADMIAGEVLASYRPKNVDKTLGEEAVAEIANYWADAFAPMNVVDKKLKKILKEIANPPP